MACKLLSFQSLTPSTNLKKSVEGERESKEPRGRGLVEEVRKWYLVKGVGGYVVRCEVLVGM